MDFKTCSIEGCERESKARGWCSAHYHRWSRYGDPLAGSSYRIGEARCQIDGCERREYAHGWCSMHWKRWRRHGNPNITLRAPSGSGNVTAYGYRRFFGGEGPELEHRKVMKQILGCPIPEGFEVHHKDRDRLNNDPSNLELLPIPEHRALHARERKL